MSASWSVVSLTDLISALAGTDEDVDYTDHILGVAEALETEVAAVCTSADVLFQHGFGRRNDAGPMLRAAASSTDDRFEFGALGELHVARAVVDDSEDTLLFARAQGEFTADEVGFVRAVGRVIGLSARARTSLVAERTARQDLQERMDENRRLVGQLRERQGLLDRLFRIQQSISHRAPTQDVLDSITNGALDLLGVGRANLRLRDKHVPSELVTVSSRGYEADEIEQVHISSIDDGFAGRCVREERLVVFAPDDFSAERVLPDSQAIMAAPVHVNGEVVGCLTVTSLAKERQFSPSEQEALLSFAEHASLALQDARAIDAMRNALTRERHRAEHDPLTGLPNRTTIQHHIDQLIDDVDQRAVSVLFVDLDRFKLTNDTLGHSFGDIVLVAVADRLRTSVREGDLVGRLSGDEFVVVCEGISEVGAIELAERIQLAIGEPIHDGRTDHVITASVGIAGAMVDDSAEALIANADLAMYRAKEAGRARIEIFDHRFRESLEARLTVGQDLRRALLAKELVVFLQPLVQLPACRVVGFEALVRWDHPERGLVFPDEFIPLAEETGLIADVDRMVLEGAISLLANSSVQRPVAVNLSARTFGDSSLIPWLVDRLDFHGVGPELITVEVTETVLMESTGAAAQQLSAIRDLGISVMIDDFGTGYSSLAYLQTFDVDGVKIDRSFIGLLGSDARASAIVSAVLHMAEALDLAVVAEGVETDEQVDIILGLWERTRTVELIGQGYLFGRPELGEQRLSGFLEVPPAPATVAPR